MGGGRKFLQYPQHQEQCGERYFDVCYRLLSTGYHARWLVSPTQSRSRQVCTDTLPLETGPHLALAYNRRRAPTVGFYFFRPEWGIRYDVPDTIPDDNVNRRNTDVPLPRGLCLSHRSCDGLGNPP